MIYIYIAVLPRFCNIEHGDVVVTVVVLPAKIYGGGPDDNSILFRSENHLKSLG